MHLLLLSEAPSWHKFSSPATAIRGSTGVFLPRPPRDGKYVAALREGPGVSRVSRTGGMGLSLSLVMVITSFDVWCWAGKAAGAELSEEVANVGEDLEAVKVFHTNLCAPCVFSRGNSEGGGPWTRISNSLFLN